MWKKRLFFPDINEIIFYSNETMDHARNAKNIHLHWNENCETLAKRNKNFICQLNKMKKYHDYNSKEIDPFKFLNKAKIIIQ